MTDEATNEQKVELFRGEELKARAMELYMEGRSVQSISKELNHDHSTIKRWITELKEYWATLPEVKAEREARRHASLDRLNHIKMQAWKKFHAADGTPPSPEGFAGKKPIRGAAMAQSRLLEIILRAEELQGQLEGTVGPRSRADAALGGGTIERTLKWVVTGPADVVAIGDGRASAGSVVETTRVLPDERAALGPGGRDRLGEEPRGSDEGHRLRVTVDTVARSDPGTDERQLEEHDDEEVL